MTQQKTDRVQDTASMSRLQALLIKLTEKSTNLHQVCSAQLTSNHHLKLLQKKPTDFILQPRRSQICQMKEKNKGDYKHHICVIKTAL